MKTILGWVQSNVCSLDWALMEYMEIVETESDADERKRLMANYNMLATAKTTIAAVSTNLYTTSGIGVTLLLLGLGSDGEVRDRNFDKRTFARGFKSAPRLKPKASQTWGSQSTGDKEKEDPVHVRHEKPQRQAAGARRTHWPRRTKLTKRRHAPNRICMCFAKPSQTNHVYV